MAKMILTYDEALCLSYAYYNDGGDCFFECVTREEYESGFSCGIKNGYPKTKTGLLREFERCRERYEEFVGMNGGY